MSETPQVVETGLTPLAALSPASDLQMHRGRITPRVFAGSESELASLVHTAAVYDLGYLTRIRITGDDRLRWLNGMVTNTVQSLSQGYGNYTLILNAQGRIQGDGYVFRALDHLLLETDRSQVSRLLPHLDHFIIMDDVELTPTSSEWYGLLLAGPKAAELLQAIVPAVEPPTSLHLLPGTDNSLIFTPIDSMIPIFEILGSPDVIANLLEAVQQHGATLISPEALEALRLLEGRPLYGRDITEKYLPQETNQPQALHFNKGCYLGQEIVERIRSRGQVHRLLTPLTLTGNMPTEFPAPLEANGKPVGEITSAALVPLPEGDQVLALGYVRREALDTHAALTYSGGSAAPRSASKSLTTNN